MRLEEQIKKLRKTKVLRKVKHTETKQKEQKDNRREVWRCNWKNKSKDIDKKRKNKKKRTCLLEDFAFPAEHKSKNKRKPYLVYLEGSAKAWKNGGIRNQRKNQDALDHSIVKINQITEKGSGDMRWLVITQTPAKEH